MIRRKDRLMIRISPMFSDNMVLQRGKNISVFGSGDEGEKVTVTLGANTAHAFVRNGKWTAVLPAMEAADGLVMTVSAEGYSRTFTGVAIGEVWLAGGQSNMEYELQNCTTGKEHLENDTGVNVRFYYTQKINSLEPGYEEKITNNGWQTFSAESAKCWSAVGYIFAKRLSEKLGWKSEDYEIALSKSFMLSADNAHAVHPNYAEKADPINRPVLNGGIVIKYNAAQKYTSDAVTSAFFKMICKKAGVPYQIFTNNSNIAGGSTLGNISQNHVSIPCVDIGLAQWAMHSPYESAGAEDVGSMIKAVKCFYSTRPPVMDR